VACAPGVPSFQIEYRPVDIFDDGWIEGEVRTLDGTRTQGVMVRAECLGGHVDDAWTSNGEFALHNLGLGPCNLTYRSKRGDAGLVHRVEIRKATTTRVRIRLDVPAVNFVNQ